MEKGGGGGGESGSCDDDDQLLHFVVMPEDVLIQILLFLPVISLLRFKSVCKSWGSIIQSTFFIHLHTTTTTTTKLGGNSSSSVLIGLEVLEKEKEGNILMLSGEEFDFFDNLSIPVTLFEYLIDEVEKESESRLKSFLNEYMDFLMVGCCDGIICLHAIVSRNVVLWNPAIKQSRFIPKPSNLLGFSKCFVNIDDDHYRSEDFVRFGIDIKNNDYKVLLITTYKTSHFYYSSDDPLPPHERRFHVYSLSTDSWTCIDDATLSDVHPDQDIHLYGHQGQYINGSYFFTVIDCNEEMPLLLSFDFTEEIFRTIQPPSDVKNNYKYVYSDVYFISFGEKVALVDHKREEGEVHFFYEYNIWVLNEQHSGMKESWTKFYTIGPSSKVLDDLLFITNNGEFAITFVKHRQYEPQQGALQLLNLITGEKKVLRCNREGLTCNSVQVYKPSLMPIGGNSATPK